MDVRIVEFPETRVAAVEHRGPRNSNTTIPGGRCAVARHHGSRERVTAATYLAEVWLPSSGEAVRDFPMFFHSVNVGPQVREQDMITDVYLPLR
jgi:AraC family transcriptional regulator